MRREAAGADTHTHSVLPVWLAHWSCWPWVKLGYQAQGFQHMEQPAPAQITQETNQLSASQHKQEAGVASSRDRFDLCQWWLTWLLALLLASTYQVRVSCVWHMNRLKVTALPPPPTVMLPACEKIRREEKAKAIHVCDMYTYNLCTNTMQQNVSFCCCFSHIFMHSEAFGK